MITLSVNGKLCELEESVSITQLLERYNIIAAMVVVEKNGTILEKDSYDSEIVAEKDNIEIIKFAGGGWFCNLREIFSPKPKLNSNLISNPFL